MTTTMNTTNDHDNDHGNDHDNDHDVGFLLRNNDPHTNHSLGPAVTTRNSGIGDWILVMTVG